MKTKCTLACLVLLLMPGWSANAKMQPPPISFSTVSLKRHDGPDTIDARYPKFTGRSQSVLDLNIAVKKLLDESLVQRNDECPTCKGSYTCDFLTGSVTPKAVSMRFSFSHYYEGTPHGESQQYSFNYRTIPQLKEIKIGELVDDNDELHKLSALIVQKLKVKLAENFQQSSGFEISELDNFTFDAQGVTWKWGTYVIGPYTAGCPEVTLSYAELNQVSPKFAELQRLSRK